MRVMKQYDMPLEAMNFDGFEERAEEVSRYDLSRKLIDAIHDGDRYVVQFGKESHTDYAKFCKVNTLYVDLMRFEPETVYVPHVVETPMGMWPNFKHHFKCFIRKTGWWFYKETNGEFGYNLTKGEWIWDGS